MKIVVIVGVVTSPTTGPSIPSTKQNEVRHGKPLENDCMGSPPRGTTEEAKRDVGV